MVCFLPSLLYIHLYTVMFMDGILDVIIIFRLTSKFCFFVNILTKVKIWLWKIQPLNMYILKAVPPNKSQQSIIERGRCLNTFILVLSAACVLNVCVWPVCVFLQGPADELPPKRNDLSPPLLWPSYAKGINPSDSFKQATIKACREPCVCIYGCGTVVHFNSVQLS